MYVLLHIPLIGACCAAAMALAALTRRKVGPADWSFVAGILALAAESACVALTVRSRDDPETMVFWQQWRQIAAAFMPGPWLLFSLCYARGNAREFLRKWRWLVAVTFGLPIGLALVFRGLLVVGVRRGGLASEWFFPLGWAGFALNVMILAATVLILMNLERTFRASVGTIRWRIKFMLMAVGLILVVRFVTVTQALLFRGADLSIEFLNGGAVIVAALLAIRSFLRTAKVELDVYPSKSVLHGTATVFLAGLYLVVVGLFARVLARIGRGNVFASEALLVLVALAIFVVLLQSDRLRMRLARFLSRNFQRPLYDYRTVWRRFTEGTASQVDQTELCRSLVKLAADVFQCLSVAIWVIDERGEALTLAASTFLSEARAKSLALSRAETGVVIGHFLEHPEPADIEAPTEEFAILLRRAHPSEFPKRENRVCLPMVARGQVIALLVLGDRVGGMPFSAQDFDMLKCVGDHATASLLNVQLGQKLLEAKEMEAFQAMAAFFVHDLKNAASILGLMLKNLPVHFDDPAFREDALRGVSKSVNHINHVIGRLSLIRHELKIDPTETDLNEIVASAVAGLDSESEFVIEKDLSDLPKTTLDREQISKVVTNLVLNAKEATGGKGRVRLITGRQNGWLVLTVEDNGCGMSQEFLEKSLFRPFQTTKQNGLGIGMFQSKMIVEVHGGRIAVSSEPGSGTTFQVYLPAKLRTG